MDPLNKSDQPRDEKGRFASNGSSAGPGEVGRTNAASHTEAAGAHERNISVLSAQGYSVVNDNTNRWGGRTTVMSNSATGQARLLSHTPKLTAGLKAEHKGPHRATVAEHSLPKASTAKAETIGEDAVTKGANVAKKRMYAEIQKVEDQDDGTIKVWGYASTGSKDSDGEIITADCMKAAIPDYMKFGAVREMHQPMAAGTAIEARVEDDGKTWFGAHVVDPIAVKKVQTGVYKGFSIGGKVPPGGRDSVNKSIINKMNLIEVSLVDRPANPDAIITVMKVERTAEDDVNELAELLDAGVVTPARVLELVKAAQSGEGTPAQGDAQPVVDGSGAQGTSDSSGEPVQKGMYDVAQFASLLSSLSSICREAQWEAQYEADSSPVPSELLAWLKAGAAIFSKMAKEEVDELIAGLTPEDSMKVETPEVTKVETPETIKGELMSGPSIEELVTKALAPTVARLETIEKENADLKDQVAKMGKMAGPGKAFLKALTVTKAADSQNPVGNSAPEETPPPEGTIERAEYEMRKVYQQGGRRIVG